MAISRWYSSAWYYGQYILKNYSCSQGWQYRGSTVRGTVRLNFCYEVPYAGTVRLFCNDTGMVQLYGTLQKLK